MIGGISSLIYQVFNFSTGRTIHKISFDSEVTAMDHAHTGQLIFCGDGMVCSCLYSFAVLFGWTCISFTDVVYWIICCRGVYILLVWILTQGYYLALIGIEVAAGGNPQSQLCSTEVFRCWLGVLCCWHVRKMEVCLSSGLVGRTCLFSFFFYNRFVHCCCFIYLFFSFKYWQEDWFAIVLRWKYKAIWLFVAHSN